MMDPSYNGPKMEARRSSGSSVVEAPREIDADKEARVYGSRWEEVETTDGDTSFQEVPLTWEDLFDPQEGDHVPHGTEHADLISETKESLKAFFDAQNRSDVLVCDDVKMLWTDPKLPRVGPDVAVIPGVEDPDRSRDSFDELREGTRPSFVLEVTSKATAPFDRGEKPDVFRRAKVQECFVLDRLKSPWELKAYRLDAKTGEYLEVVPDERGRYPAETIGVHFSIAESGEALILEDAATGQPLLKPREESVARQAAERRAEAAEAKVRELLAEIERLRS